MLSKLTKIALVLEHRLRGNHANADSSLISAGIVTATAFYGDGSNLEGVASAGLGTAVDDTKDSIGQNIYFTNAELSINENTTVNAPDTSNIAYTQYQQVTVESGSELIISDGDSFIPDVLGIGTALQASTAGAGNGLFGTVFVDNIENAAGRGGPNFPLGITVAGVSTLSGNVSIGGTLTYEDVTNVDSVGMVTARNGIDITGGDLNAASNLILKVDGGEKVRITSTGNVGIGIANPSEKLTVSSGNLAFIGGTNDAQYIKFGDSGDDDIGNIFYYHGNNNMVFTTNTTEKLRITSDGALGLNGTNYGTSGQVLTSQGSGSAVQWATPSGGLSMVDEWGQFSGDGNTSYGPWNNTTFGSGGNYGQLTRSAYSSMPIGAGMTHSSGVFQFPATGIYEVAAKWVVGRHSQNTGILIKLQLSTDSGSSYVSGYDSNGLDLARDDVHSSYGRLSGTITNSIILNIANASTYRVKFQITTTGGSLEYYVRPSSKIIFKKLN